MQKGSNGAVNIVRAYDLAHDVAHAADISVKQAHEIIQIVFASIKVHLYRKEEVRIPKFGAFTLFRRKSRVMPVYMKHTQEKHSRYIPPCLIPKFRYNTKIQADIRDLTKEDECTQESTPD